MCDFQYTEIDFGIIGGKTRNQVLNKDQYDVVVAKGSIFQTNINKSIPSLPEIGIGDNANGFSQLRLYARRHRGHQTNKLTLDSYDFIFRKLVRSVFVLYKLFSWDRGVAWQWREPTTQLNLIKFLKHNAPASRVLRGRASEARISRRRMEKLGLVSSCLSATSAIGN